MCAFPKYENAPNRFPLFPDWKWLTDSISRRQNGFLKAKKCQGNSQAKRGEDSNGGWYLGIMYSFGLLSLNRQAWSLFEECVSFISIMNRKLQCRISTYILLISVAQTSMALHRMLQTVLIMASRKCENSVFNTFIWHLCDSSINPRSHSCHIRSSTWSVEMIKNTLVWREGHQPQIR